MVICLFSLLVAEEKKDAICWKSHFCYSNLKNKMFSKNQKNYIQLLHVSFFPVFSPAFLV